jgi:hypothetical protein
MSDDQTTLGGAKPVHPTITDALSEEATEANSQFERLDSWI